MADTSWRELQIIIIIMALTTTSDGICAAYRRVIRRRLPINDQIYRRVHRLFS